MSSNDYYVNCVVVRYTRFDFVMSSWNCMTDLSFSFHGTRQVNALLEMQNMDLRMTKRMVCVSAIVSVDIFE